MTLDPPENGLLYPFTLPEEILPGQVLIFSCNDGFTRSGCGRLICQDDGRWDRSPPTCEPSGKLHFSYQHIF